MILLSSVFKRREKPVKLTYEEVKVILVLLSKYSPFLKEIREASRIIASKIKT